MKNRVNEIEVEIGVKNILIGMCDKVGARKEGMGLISERMDLYDEYYDITGREFEE